MLVLHGFGSMDRCLLMVLVFGALLVSKAHGDDWPQILGPNRDGVSREQLPPRFPAEGPAVVWSAAVGQGYAGPVVVGSQVVAFHRSNEKERVESFDARTGKSQWKVDYPAYYRGGVDTDKGPRCVPLVSGDRIYVYGAAGECHCLELKQGKKVWSRSLAVDYDASEGYFGAGSTPILVGDVLLVNVGGKKAGIVGLDAATGKTKFTGLDDDASYSSPALLRRGQSDRAVFITRLNCVEVDPKSGSINVLFPFGRSGATVNAAVPLVIDTQVFATSSYGVGAALFDLKGGGPQEVWANDATLSSQYNTPVLHEGHLYGIHGREDIPPAHLRCVELATGKVKWSQDDFGVAHAILAGDKLLLLTVEGELVLVEASPKAYRELGRARIAKSTTRAIPALANGRFYCRSSDKLLCIKVGE